jgi:hypothetical protein
MVYTQQKNLSKGESVLYCLTEPISISRYLQHVAEDLWGATYVFNFSNNSEAIYNTLKFTREAGYWHCHLRIANHPPNKNSHSGFDFDIYASFFRPNATNYLQLLTKISQKLTLPLPSEISYVLQKQNLIKYHNVMHSRAKFKNKKSYNFSDLIYFN